MPVLFGTIRDDHIQPTIRKAVDVLEDLNMYDHLYGEAAICADYEFTQIQLDGLRATLESVKGNCVPSIVYEGFEDVAESIVAWFKKWLHRFVEYCKRAFHNLQTMIIHATSKSGEFDEVVKPEKFKSFTVKGYNYTIAGSALDTSFINDLMSATAKAVQEISQSDEPKSVVKEFIQEHGIGATIDSLRGKLIKEDEVSESDWSKTLHTFFRNGDEDAEEIDISYAVAKTISKNVKVFENYLKICEVDKKKLEDASKNIISHVGGQPALVRKYDIEKKERKAVNGPKVDPVLDSLNDRYVAITEIYTVSNRVLERAIMVYDQYLTAKMRALSEAVRWYIGVLNKARGEKK